MINHAINKKNRADNRPRTFNLKIKPNFAECSVAAKIANSSFIKVPKSFSHKHVTRHSLNRQSEKLKLTFDKIEDEKNAWHATTKARAHRDSELNFILHDVPFSLSKNVWWLSQKTHAFFFRLGALQLRLLATLIECNVSANGKHRSKARSSRLFYPNYFRVDLKFSLSKATA